MFVEHVCQLTNYKSKDLKTWNLLVLSTLDSELPPPPLLLYIRSKTTKHFSTLNPVMSLMALTLTSPLNYIVVIIHFIYPVPTLHYPGARLSEKQLMTFLAFYGSLCSLGFSELTMHLQ